MLQSLEGQKTYNVYQLASAEQRAGSSFLFSRPFVDVNWSELKKSGAKYVVVNYADPNPKTHEFILSISDRLELAQSFTPYWKDSKKISVDRHDSTAAPHLAQEIFSRKSLGPYLEVYRVKDIS